MAAQIGNNRSTNDTATVSDAIAITTSASVLVSALNLKRTFFCINNNNAQQGVWVKLQAASVDDDMKGIFIPARGSWAMPTASIYTGEISAIADNNNTDVYVTEY